MAKWTRTYKFWWSLSVSLFFFKLHQNVLTMPPFLFLSTNEARLHSVSPQTGNYDTFVFMALLVEVISFSVHVATSWLLFGNVIWMSSVCNISALAILPQVCCHRLGLCQLSQAGVSQRRLRRRVLLPLQTGLASQPDVWLGSPAEGALPPHPQ